MVCNLLKVRTAGLSSAGLSSARGKSLRFINSQETHQSQQHEAKTTCDRRLLQQCILLLVD